jgi:hypothetical protein
VIAFDLAYIQTRIGDEFDNAVMVNCKVGKVAEQQGGF